MTYPKTHLLNPEFVYTNSAHTDIRETFRKATCGKKEEDQEAPGTQKFESDIPTAARSHTLRPKG